MMAITNATPEAVLGIAAVSDTISQPAPLAGGSVEVWPIRANEKLTTLLRAKICRSDASFFGGRFERVRFGREKATS